MPRVRHLVAAIAIFLMVAPPLFDTFDTWDKGPELPAIGHNTETDIVITTAGVGICFAVATAAIFALELLSTLFAEALELGARVFRVVFVYATDYLLLLYSPPWRVTALRI